MYMWRCMKLTPARCTPNPAAGKCRIQYIIFY